MRMQERLEPLRMTTDTLRLGASWYPEQWDEATQRADVALMRELGFNTIRMGEFAWARYESDEGRYDIDWMADALALAHEHGLMVLLCTPTAAPPPWLLQHPEVGYVRPDGYRYGPGGRQAGDYCNPTFRDYCRKIVRVVAEAFGRHPALIGWQTDNELRGHQKLSVSEAAVAGWRRWLCDRYGEIDALNEAWGTQVWSQRYGSFEEVPTPSPLPNYAHNFALLTQYRRYMNDAVLEFQRLQVEVIRAHSAAPITHNSEDSVDEWDLTRDLDFAAHDCYAGNRPPLNMVYRTDCFRSLKPGRRFWVAETDSEGTVGDDPFPSGWLANFAMLSYAGGAEAVTYWPWRGTRSGTEIVGHSCLVYASGGKASGWGEAAKAAQLRETMSDVVRRYAPAPAAVAFVRSERNGHYYYIDRIAGLQPDFNFKRRLEAHHHTLQNLGAWRDVLYDHAGFEGYRVVFSPYLPYTSPHFLDEMERHLHAGGAWVVGPYTGYLTQDHTIPTNALLGDLEKRFDFVTQHFVRIKSLPVALADGTAGEAALHAHIFEPAPDDEVLGHYGGPRLGGAVWGLRRRVGQGAIYLLGSELDDASRTALYRSILKRENIRTFPMPTQVLRLPQVGRNGQQAWALVNINQFPQNVELPSEGVDLLTGAPVTRAFCMPANSNAFVEFTDPVTE